MKRISLILLLATGCMVQPKRNLLGKLPKATTRATPQWIPWRMGAGKPFPSHPSELQLHELRRLTFDGRNVSPQWHPDGRQLLIQRLDGQGHCAGTVVLELGHGKTRPWPGSAGTQVALAKAPDGTLLSATATPSAQTSCSPLALGKGLPQPLAAIGVQSQQKKAAPAGAKAAAPAGAKAATPQATPRAIHCSEAFLDRLSGQLFCRGTYKGDSEIYRMRKDGSQRQRLSNRPGYDGQPRLAPDGSMLVWTAGASPRPAQTDAEQDAGAPKQAKGAETPKQASASTKTTPASSNLAPSQPPRFRIMLASSSGHNPRVLTPATDNSIGPVFLNDSRHILFASDRNRRSANDYDVYLLDTASTAAASPDGQRLSYSKGFNGQPAISPDGQWLAFTSERAGKGFDIFVARLGPKVAPNP